MTTAVVSWALSILLLANANPATPVLYWIDWIVAVVFAISGAQAGWAAARK